MRRSCFSCGRSQAGSGDYCSSCGKRVDTPELEMLSGELATDTGTDVEISSGVSRGRSLMVIGVAIAAIAGAATFSGKGSTSAAPTTAAASTTTATAQGSSTSTTSTSVPLPETTLRNALTTDGDSNATAPTAPPVPLVQTVTSPILPEKSGLKLLVVGLGPPIDGRRVDAVVDLDSGVITRTIATFISNGNNNTNPVTIQPYRSGVVVSDFNIGTITTVTADGIRRSTSVRLSLPNAVIIGDIYWTSLFSDQSTSFSAALVGIDLTSGEEVARIDIPGYVELVGTTSDGKPVVVEYGTGTYSLDIETQSFTLITPQQLRAIDRGNRLERRCDASLHCRSIVQFANGAVVDIPATDTQNDLRVELAPSGDRALLRTFNDGGTGLSVLDFKTGERLSLGSDNASQNPFTTFSWSTDGQWLFGVRNGALIAWKVGWAKPITLTFDGAPVSAVSVAIFPTVV